MSVKLEFTNTSNDFNMTTHGDIGSLRCGDVSISFLSRAKWFIVYKTIEDANKQSIQKFLAGEANTLAIMLQGSGATCGINIGDNRFSFFTSYDCCNFMGATSLSCQYDFEDNKTEIMKFINYLHQQYETKA